MKLTASDLAQRVTILDKSVTRDAYGAEVVSWVPFASNVAAKVEMPGGSDQVVADMREGHRRVVVTIRYLDGVKNRMQVQWGTFLFGLNVWTMIGRREFLRMECEDWFG